jgi:hypothetical protein
MLAKFPTILHPSDVVHNPIHGVEHHIQTGGQPTPPPHLAKTHRLDPDQLEITKAEFKRLESACIIRRSTSTCIWYKKTGATMRRLPPPQLGNNSQ